MKPLQSCFFCTLLLSNTFLHTPQKPAKFTLILWLTLLTILPLQLSAQMLKGRVCQSGTNTGIPQASVYYNNTLTGTSTNNNGEFSLELKPGNNQVIVSCVGYNTAVVDNAATAAQPLTVYLTPKIQQLKDVVIAYDGMQYEDKVALFKKEFIGTSPLAQSCTITNIEDVDLVYNKKTATLTAASDKPIQIENKLLGYHISYFLSRFERTPTNVTFSGTSMFTETVGKDDRRQVERNRASAYEGSRMQLIRALWYNNLSHTKFVIYTPHSQLFNADSLVIENKAHEKFIALKAGILISYTNGYDMRQSRIAKTSEPCYIGYDGFSNASIRWSGSMGVQRVGDLLPFEYQYPKEHYKAPEITVNATTTDTNAVARQVTPPPKFIPQLNFATEKVYLHTDRDLYAAGDDIWFKAYLADAQTNQPSLNSNNLYVELISPKAEVIQREMVRIDSGTGTADLKLSAKLQPDNYRLRAYTNYMRNFADAFVFDKPITIVSFPNGKPAATPIAKSTTKLKANSNTAVADTVSSPHIQFFPEGGYLVNGLTSIIALKAENEFGLAIPVQGDVLTRSGRKVVHFVCDSTGTTSFKFKPADTETYYAEAIINGQVQQFKFPEALRTGFIMSVSQSPGNIVTDVACNDISLPQPSNNIMLIVAQHAGKICDKRYFKMSNTHESITIAEDGLPEGVTDLILFDQSNRPLARRLVYVHHDDNTTLQVTADKAIYHPKEKVTLKIKLSDVAPASLSLAAVDAAIVPVQAGDIASYLNLTSEVKGSIEHAERYFDTTNVNRFKQLDMLLRTQGWSSYLWQRLADSIPRVTYQAEQGITLNGHVQAVFGKKALPGLSITMFAPKAKQQKLFWAVTDEEGKFSFDASGVYGYQYIYFTSRNAAKMADGKSKGHSGGWIKVDSLPQNQLPVYAAYPCKQPDTSGAAELLIERERLKKKFDFNGNNQLKTVQIRKPKRGFSDPIYDIHIIGPAEHRDYGSLMQYCMFMIPNSREAEGGCHTIKFDSTGTSRPGQILTYGAFPARKVQIFGFYANHSSIDYRNVCDDDYWNQPMINVLKVSINHIFDANGVYYSVTVVLKPGVLEKHDIFDNTIADITGYYNAREFYKPVYDAANQTKTDLRTTIHWEPNIKTQNGEATITFYNADPKTNVRVIVQGISSIGQPLVGTAVYSVK